MSKPVHLHDAYWTAPEPLVPADVKDMHQLSVAVSWPHRPDDLQMVMGFGQGYIARDEIQRPMGAGMRIPYGTAFSMIGMMMTQPKLQSGGLGAMILERLLEDTKTCSLRLNATRSAHRLYRSTGFVDVGTVHQYQGTVTAFDSSEFSNIRPAQETDLGAIIALDAETFGVARPEVIQMLWSVSDTLVFEANGAVIGFAMCRLFGRGHLIGPLSAPGEAEAIGLAQAFLRDKVGAFARLDADARHDGLGKTLNSIGLLTYDKIFAMTKDGSKGPEDAGGQVYALASQAFG